MLVQKMMRLCRRVKNNLYDFDAYSLKDSILFNILNRKIFTFNTNLEKCTKYSSNFNR